MMESNCFKINTSCFCISHDSISLLYLRFPVRRAVEIFICWTSISDNTSFSGCSFWNFEILQLFVFDIMAIYMERSLLAVRSSTVSLASSFLYHIRTLWRNTAQMKLKPAVSVHHFQRRCRAILPGHDKACDHIAPSMKSS